MLTFLYDLTATQPTPDSKFHGAGEYGEIIFLKLLFVFDSSKVRLCAVSDSGRYLNPLLSNAAKEKKVPLFDIQKQTPSQIFEANHIDRFYSALLDESIPWPLDTCEVITTVHGLRSLEMPLDKIALAYDTKLKNKIKNFIKLYVMPKQYLEKVYNGYKRFFTGKMKIITVSQHSKASILSFFPNVKPEDVHVFASPTFDQIDISYDSSGQSDIISKNDLIGKKYFLLTSSARWIKNNMRAVFAFDELFSSHANGMKDFKVVLTGVSNKSVFLKHIANKDHFILLDYVERNDLASLEKNAYAFMYPSLNEGFGYPPVEAMKYGIPVAASGTSSIPEVCGNAALYFDPYSVSEIKNRIIQLLDLQIHSLYASRSAEQWKAVFSFQQNDLATLTSYLLN
jgi:glycosyltransferase involved in cell wall biosynthesis